jgi:hypothetical protein
VYLQTDKGSTGGDTHTIQQGRQQGQQEDGQQTPRDSKDRTNEHHQPLLSYCYSASTATENWTPAEIQDQNNTRSKTKIKKTPKHKDQPEQRKKGTLITAITITIIAIATTSAGSAHIVAAAYGTNNEGEQRKREDTVSRIERATMIKIQVTGEQALATHIKQGMKTTKHHKWENKVDAKHDTTDNSWKDNHVSLPY